MKKYPLLAAALLFLAACGGADSDAQDDAAADVAAEMTVPADTAPELPNAGMGSENPMALGLAEIGGSMEAAVALCGIDVNRADFAESKRQQQEQFIQMGGTRGQFEAAYQAGHDRATADYEAADSAERQAMCDGLKEFAAARSAAG